MGKEKVQGIVLQMEAIFARLDALKKVLSTDELNEYTRLIEERKQRLRDEYDVNVDQLDEWFQ